ncbi:hypothetical protein HPB49_012941 [Dermacentor silvarum]|uniref:Uncharacterized protein n=1 Tax=Dermacentor silvarum TaxID=543639 RepID=A0ACB8C3N8_DERSI|nr:hypothetical protein HPB49_012941 [Dermacentor silvarum]
MRNVSQIKFAQSLEMAAALSEEDVAEDVVCPNMMQKIAVISTPAENNARAYSKINTITIGGFMKHFTDDQFEPVGQIEPEERHATLMIDEIQLTPGLSYDASSGTVFGAPTMPLADGTLPLPSNTCSCVYAWWCSHPLEAGCGIPSHRQFLFGKGNEARCCRHNN